jgi:Leucine-rich repeat (LRR) protein
VVSSNLLSSLGGALSACSSLLKLSLAHNDVASLKGALRGCPALQELRCAHNSLKVSPRPPLPPSSRNSGQTAESASQPQLIEALLAAELQISSISLYMPIVLSTTAGWHPALSA